METYQWKMKTGIVRSKEFEKKGLACFAVNCGLKCGHDCRYCSTGAMIRTHRVFKELGLNPFENGYAIVDPSTPDRVAYDAKHMRNKGLVQLCTISDAWSPEAQEYNIGRKCLEAILAEPGWTIRILTKNAAVEKDFDLIANYRDRVTVGLSVTAAPEKTAVISAIEPGASPVTERLRVLQQAHAMGLRTYAMLCPLMPGIADGTDQIEALVKTAVEYGSEEIFAEPVNPRGRGLILTQQALEQAGYHAEAAQIKAIRSRTRWSGYVVALIRNLQQSVRRHSDISKLRVLLYPKGLESHDVVMIQKDDAGVVWLGSKI